MATKNLARTAIEGGRTGRNKWERRYSHKENRAAEKSFISEVFDDPESFYDNDIEETRTVGKMFNDKLGPMYRWLERQIGKRWDEVRSEVTKAFDTRTTAGRHIVYDHLLRSVAVNPEVHLRYVRIPNDPLASYSKYDFYVDENGLLQKKRYISGWGHSGDRPPPFNVRQIANWLAGRIVGKVGDKFFWFVPVGKSKKGWGSDRTWRIQWGYDRYYSYGGNGAPRFAYLNYNIKYKLDGNGLPIWENGKRIEVSRTEEWVPAHSTPSLRQGRKLNTKEMDFWNTLPEYYQTKVLELSPNYPTPPKPAPYGYYFP